MPRKPSLVPYLEKSRRRWVLRIPADLSPTGKPKRETFVDRTEAFDRAERLRRDTKESERAVRVAGPELVRAALNFDELFREIYEFKGGLVEACEAFMKQIDEADQSLVHRDILEDYRALKWGGWSRDYRTTWNWMCKGVAELDERPLVTLTTSFWNEWLEERMRAEGWTAATFNNFVNVLSTAWNHAVKQDRVARNPLVGVIRKKVRTKHKAIYTVGQVRKLMDCAWEHDREMVPFFAIAIFAGLRPDVDGEIGKLEWEDVNFEEGWIRVGKNFDNKTETRRFVPMEENLKLWLEPWRGASGAVLPSNFVRRRRYITRGKYQSPKRTPEKDWVELVPYGRHVNDITRHTYGSYLEAKYRDRNVVKENMGHTSYSTYEQHYRNARSPQEAEAFWSIVPQTGDHAPNSY